MSTRSSKVHQNGHYPPLPAAHEESATIALCIAAHLNEDFRAEILRQMLPKGLTATGPSPGIDLVAVWRHAVEADERWKRVANRLDDVRTALMIPVVAAVAGIGAGVGTKNLGWAVFGVLAAILTATATLLYGRRILLGTVRTSMDKVRDLLLEDADPRDKTKELDEDEQRIDAMQNANLIVFSRRSPSPFIGSGIPVEHLVMVPVNVGRAASKDASDAQPKPFTVIDVHQYLEEALSEHAPDSIKPVHRLYMRGDVIATPGRTPWGDRDKPPPTEVDDQWIWAGVARPTGQARTYLCLQRALNGGWLIVSMFVRVSLHGKMLSLEIATHVLPGLAAQYIASDGAFADYFDNQGDPRARHTVESACDAVTGQLLWNYLIHSRWKTANDQSGARAEEDEGRSEDALEAERRGALGERIHDFGAETSIRERLSPSYLVDHFEMLDAQDFLQRAHRSVIDSLGDFLAEHDVDISEFRARRDQIINNMKFEIQGTGHHIGTNGQVTNVTTKESEANGNNGNQR